MNKFTAMTVTAALAASMGAFFTPAVGADSGRASVRVAGEKLDSGLGDLPHYRNWTDPSGKQVQPTQAADSSRGKQANAQRGVQVSQAR